MIESPVEEIAFERINPAPYNPRVRLKPGDPEYHDIEASLGEFGLVQTLVWNRRTGNLVAGHQRFYISQERGKTSAQCSVVDLPIEAEQRLNLILNKVTGRWDRQKLETILRGLQENAIDIDRLGFTKIELNRIFGAKPKPMKRNPDDAPAPTIEDLAYTLRGDVYELRGLSQNPHRLVCGDSRNEPDIRLALGGQKARLLFTDPPYGGSYAGQGERTKNAPIDNDELRAEALLAFLAAVFTAAHEHTTPDAALYCFYASRNHIAFETALLRAGWTVRQQLIWCKQLVLGRSHYQWSHEPILYGGKTASTVEWFGDRAQRTVLEMTDEDVEKLDLVEAQKLLRALRDTADLWDEKRDPLSAYIHPTQKPVSLAQRALRNSSMPGEIVLDLFGGSGSTMIAAEMMDRGSSSLESSRGHCDAIVRRFLETFAGSSATLNGEPFDLEHTLKRRAIPRTQPAPAREQSGEPTEMVDPPPVTDSTGSENTPKPSTEEDDLADR